MAIGVLMAVIYLCLYTLFIAIFSPIRLIWENIWRNPKQASSMTLGAVSAIIITVYFDLPWKVIFSLAKSPISLHDVINFIASTGSLVASMIFLVLWFSIPVTFIILIKTTLYFSRENPKFFIGKMLSGFIAALYGYSSTGFVSIKIAFYGIGAIIIAFCIKTMALPTFQPAAGRSNV